MEYFNITDATAVPITEVSKGNEFIVCLNDWAAGTLSVQYDQGDGTFVTFGGGALAADGETVFTSPGTALQLKGSEASPDLHVIVQELGFRED